MENQISNTNTHTQKKKKGGVFRPEIDLLFMIQARSEWNQWNTIMNTICLIIFFNRAFCFSFLYTRILFSASIEKQTAPFLSLPRREGGRSFWVRRDSAPNTSIEIRLFLSFLFFQFFFFFKNDSPSI